MKLISDLTIKMGQMLEQSDEKQKDQERRLKTLEGKPSIWFDRIIAAAISALVTGGISAAIFVAK
jgi:hypothetical protein